MPEESRTFDKQQPLELIPDFPYESRHEFVTKLAYKLWEQRGAPSRLTGRRLVRSGTSCVRVVSIVGNDYPISE
jgi:hypothetical protein